jgi:L-2-hydroxycarboxylate dehydrogenase (NAD+)
MISQPEHEMETTISANELRSLAEQIFEAYGVNDSDAQLVADALVEADLRGHPSHGVIRIPKWTDGIKAGAISRQCAASIIKETQSVAWMDGKRALGPVVAHIASKLAAHKARETGVGLVSVCQASHIGMLQYYTDYLAAEGLIGIAATNTEPGVAPYGGVDKVLGTNPLCIAVPGRSGSMVLDMSTSQVARGKIVIAKSRGEPIPENWAIDREGRPTRDPVAALAGALLPVGGAKGSGLAIMVDLLAGALAGGAVGKGVRGTFQMDQEPTKGDLFIAIDPQALAGLDVFLSRVEGLKSDIRSSRVASGFDRILCPGEFEMECRRRHLSDGIPIESDLLTELQTRAKYVGAE